MDWLDETTAPLEYQEVAWIANISKLGQAAGWAISYMLQARKSRQDGTYGMAIFPLCCNTAWEFVYLVIYPPRGGAAKVTMSTFLLFGLVVIYSAVQSSPREWHHAQLVQRHLGKIFVVMTLYFISGHMAFAAAWGPQKASALGMMICTDMLILGSIAQLMVREGSRGTSYSIW